MQVFVFMLLMIVSAPALAVPCPRSLDCPDGATLRSDANSLACEKDDKPHGPTVLCREGIMVEQRAYRDGVMHDMIEVNESTDLLASANPLLAGTSDDVSRSTYPGTNQQHTEIYLADGQRHGTSRVWHPNGQLASKIEYEHGLPVGRAYEWHPNGKRQSILNYRAGKKHGEQHRFHPNDMIMEVTNYRDGVLHGAYQSFTETGELRLHGEYADGKKTGEWVDAAVTGGVMKGSYVAGKQHGEWRVYEPNGNLVATESFDHGRRHGPFEHFQKKRKTADGAYTQGLETGVWTTYRPNGSVARRETWDDGMKTETCEARKGGKLRCKKVVPFRLIESNCELTAGDATHDIRDAAEFSAVYTCSGEPPAIDWTQRRLWVLRTTALKYSLSFGGIERTPAGLEVVVRRETICSGHAVPRIPFDFVVLLPAGEEPITHRIDQVLREEPCGLRP